MTVVEKQALTSIDDWLEKLSGLRIPVFPETVASLKQLDEEDVERSVDRLCESVLYDPGGVLAILDKANSGRKGRLGAAVGTVENASMMIGIRQMRQLTDQYDEFKLPGETDAEKGYMKIVARSYHVAYQAYDWAVTRGDMIPKEIFVSALLHDIGAMVLWLEASEQMQAVHNLKWEQMMPDDEAQYVVLGFTQEQLGRRLADKWNLPEMVKECLRPEESHNPRAMTVKLAQQMVHLSETGWYTEEMVECLESVAALLDLDFDEVARKVHKNALEVAHETGFYGVSPSAALLPMTSAEWPSVHGGKREEDDGKHFCLMPQQSAYEDALRDLAAKAKSKTDINEIIVSAISGLHDGLGLNRVVFAMLSKDGAKLEGRYLRGADSDPNFSKFKVDVDMGKKDLFTQLMQKSRSVWLNKDNGQKIWPLIPGKFKALVDTEEFYAMSIFIHDKPFGVFYADRHLADSMLDQKSYERFKKICALVSRAIAFATLK